MALVSVGLLVAKNDAEDAAWVRKRTVVHEQATNAFAEQDWQEAQHLCNGILEH